MLKAGVHPDVNKSNLFRSQKKAGEVVASGSSTIHSNLALVSLDKRLH